MELQRNGVGSFFVHIFSLDGLKLSILPIKESNNLLLLERIFLPMSIEELHHLFDAGCFGQRIHAGRLQEQRWQSFARFLIGSA